ncbi:MAG: DMT family transporter [Treponema sp.]|nr:DMT family transporter [Treponema sp.]
MNKRFTSVLASGGLLLAAGIWGFSFVIVKDSLDYIGAMYMIAYRYTIAALAMSLIFIKKWKLINKDYLIHGALTGAFLFLAYVTQTIGCDYTTAGKNAFLTTIYVILVPFISWILTRKRPGIFVFIAAIMSLTGIGLLALGSDDAGFVNKGDVLTLICGIFFALHIIYTERFNRKGGDPLFLTLLQFVFVAIFGWISAPFFEGGFPAATAFTSRVLLSMLYLGLLSTMVGFSLQNIGLKYVQSSIASLFLSFESVFGMLFSSLFLHENLTFRMLCGCVLIFAAIVLSETTKKE